MRPMQDKEFDKVFQQKFDGFELAPSGDLWNSISRELDNRGGKRRRYSVFWMSAASIVVVLGSTMCLAPEMEKVYLR